LKKDFLVNLFRICIFIRSDIKRFKNEEILEIVLKSWNDKIILSEIVNELPLVNTQKDFDIYVDYVLEKFLLHAFERLKTLLKNKLYEEAYDLVDAIHGLPELLLRQEIKHMRDFWNVYIEPMRRKWGDCYFQEFKGFFLNDE